MMHLGPPAPVPGTSTQEPTTVPPVGGTISTPSPLSASTSTSTQSSSDSAPQGFNEGLALFVTFAILFLMSVNATTAKFAFWVGASLAAIVWIQVVTTPAGKTFWKALAQ